MTGLIIIIANVCEYKNKNKYSKKVFFATPPLLQ